MLHEKKYLYKCPIYIWRNLPCYSFTAKVFTTSVTHSIQYLQQALRAGHEMKDEVIMGSLLSGV